MTSDEAIDVVIAAWVGRFGITPAEAAILGIASAYGSTREEIALARSVNPDSVKKQVHMICRKSGARSLVAAAGAVLREALALVTDPPRGGTHPWAEPRSGVRPRPR